MGQTCCKHGIDRKLAQNFGLKRTGKMGNGNILGCCGLDSSG